jgi:hypothetical protein
MRIPILITRAQRSQRFPNVPVECTKCGHRGPAALERRWVSVHAYFVPVGHHNVEHVYTCGACGQEFAGPPAAGVPAVPFMHRFGLLVFVGAILGGLVLVIAVPIISGNMRRASYEAEQRATKEATDASTHAKAAADAAEKRCFATLNQALNAAFPKGVIKAPAMPPPADASPLRGAPFVTIKHAVSIAMPRPREAYFGPGACSLDVPPHVEAYAQHTTRGLDPEKALAGAKQLEDAAARLAPPEVVVAADYSCPKTCVAAAGWFSVREKRVLAVVRVTKPMNHLGYDGDANEIAPLLGAATASWK